MKKKYLIFSIVGLLSFVADHATKYWARHSLPGEGIRQSVVENFWDWKLAWNYGSAFSMFAGNDHARTILTVAGVVCLFFIFWMIKNTTEKQKLQHYSLGLIVGGAIGNIADRIYFGKVTDFIEWRYYEKFVWPTFNVADVVLVIGIAFIFIDGFRKDEDEEKKA